MFVKTLGSEAYMPEYLSAKDTGEKWGISRRQVVTHCIEGRIPGAFKLGLSWAIPVNAVKPDDRRMKSGKYVKSKKTPQDSGEGCAGDNVKK